MIPLVLQTRLEDWFAEILAAGNKIKAFIIQQNITPGLILSPAQGLILMRLINRFDAHRIRVAQTSHYVKRNKETLTNPINELNQLIASVFSEFDQHWVTPYEVQARDALIRYLIIRQSRTGQFAFMPAFKSSREITRDELVKRIAGREILQLHPSTRYKTLWKKAIAGVLENRKNIREHLRQSHLKIIGNFRRSDEAVKKMVADHARDHYQSLLNWHQHYMRYLDVCERVIKVYESNISELSKNMDYIGNQNARLIQMLMRGSAIGLLTPLFLGGFVDPAIEAVDKIVQIILLRKGMVHLNLEQTHVYQITGILPDPHKQTYVGAYQKLLSETVYDQFTRYRRCLQHRIDTLSKTRSLTELMTEHTRVWNVCTADQIVSAQRMNVLEKRHYPDPNSGEIMPEKESSFNEHIARPLKKMLDEIYEPIKSQYGDKHKLEGLHILLDKIEFDDDRQGLEAHNRQRESEFVLTMSNYLEIHLIVKYLVEETEYFGGNSATRPLVDGRRDIQEKDPSFGLKPDNGIIRELIMALIKRIIRTRNQQLKDALDLNPLQSEEDQIKNNLLVGWTFMSSTNYKLKNNVNYYTSVFRKYQPLDAEGDHQRRREMILAIIDAYYYVEPGLLLQRETLNFARYHGLELNNPIYHPNQDGSFIAPKWISEDEVSVLIQAKTKPFVDQALYQRKMLTFYHDLGNVYRTKKLLMEEVTKEQGLEHAENELDRRRKQFGYKY